MIAAAGSSAFTIEVSDYFNDNLANPLQGLCGVEVDFAHQYVYDFSLSLTSPGGQTVQLIGPINGQVRPFSFFTRWFIDFQRCGDSPVADPGAPVTWNNNSPFNWVAGSNYIGSYYPSGGCLEDFNTGPVNGTWTFSALSTKPFAQGAITGLRLIFCDSRGVDCCFADAGDYQPFDLLACAGDEVLDLDPLPFYNQPRPDSTEYGYTFLIARNGDYFRLDSLADLRMEPGGSYQVCGFSYRRSEIDSLPDPADTTISLADLRIDLESFFPTLCGDLAEVCWTVTIAPRPETTFLALTRCTGDSYQLGDTTLLTSGVYTHVFSGFAGCDSTVTVFLDVVDQLETTVDATICFGDAFEQGTNTYLSSGSYLDTFPSQAGCDSIVTLNLTVREEIIADLEVAVCAGDSFLIGTQSYAVTGMYSRILSSVINCDSTVNLDLAVLEPRAMIGPVGELTCLSPTLLLDASSSMAQFDRIYQWENLNGQVLGTTAQLSIDTAGTYVLVLTEDFRGTACTDRDTVMITDLRLPLAADAGPPATLTCDSVSVQLGGPFTTVRAGVTYQWTGPATEPFALGSTSPLTRITTPGTYRLLAIDGQSGCRDSSTVVVGIDTLAPTAALSGPNRLTCTINSLILAADTSFSNRSYRWDRPAPLADTLAGQISVTSAGIYSLTVRNTVNGCTAADQVTVAIDTVLPSIAINGIRDLTCTRTSVNLTAVTSGTGPVSVQWQSQPGMILGNLTNLQLSNPADYRLIATDSGNGCVDTLEFTIPVNRVFPVAEAGADTTYLTCRDSSLVLGDPATTASGVTYAWTRFTQPNDILGSADTFTVAGTGGYFFFAVTDTVNGCTSRDSVRVLLDQTPPFVRIDVPDPFDCFVNEVTLNGLQTSALGADPLISWTGACLSGPADSLVTTIDCPGEYTLNVANQINGCVGEASVTALANPNAVIAQVPDSLQLDCLGNSVTIDGSASTDGLFRWILDGVDYSFGTTAITVTAPGRYGLILRNLDGSCRDTAYTVVFADCPVLAVILPPDTLTCAVTTVTLNAANSLPPAGGPVSTEWLTGNPACLIVAADGRTAQAACPGQYGFVIVNTALGLSDTTFITVPENTVAPTFILPPPDTLTCLRDSVQLTVTDLVAGGDVSYTWENTLGDTVAQTPNFLTGLSGSYLLTVRDLNNGCSSTSAATVRIDTVPPAVQVGNNILTCEADTFLLTTTPLPAGANYEYAWMGPTLLSPANGPNLLIGEAGIYQLRLTDPSNGCTSIRQILTERLPCPPAATLPPDTLTCLVEEVRLSPVFSEACGMCTFVWTNITGTPIPGATTDTLIVTAAGTYGLVITNEFNLSTTLTTTVIDLRELPAAPGGPDGLLTCVRPLFSLGDTTGLVPGPNRTYEWIDPNGSVVYSGTTPFYQTGEGGLWQLRVIDVPSSCIALDTVVLTYDTLAPTVLAGPTQSLTCEENLRVLSGSGSSTGSAFEYRWTGGPAITCLEGDTTLNPIVACPGVYTFSVRDRRNGCTAVDSTTILAEDNLPILIPLADTLLDCRTDSILLSPTLPRPNLRVEWCPLPTAAVPVPVCSGQLDYWVSESGDYRFSVLDTLTGCGNSFVTTVGLDRDPPPINAGLPDTLFCTLDSLAIGGGGSTQLEYAWTSSLGIPPGAADQAIAYAFVPDRYFLEVTDPRTGCTALDSVDVLRDIAAPLADAGLDSTLTCTRREIRLNGTGSTLSGQIGYQWLVPGAGNIVLGATTTMPLINAAGTYVFAVTDPDNNCTGFDPVVITEDRRRPVAAIAGLDTLLLTCDRQSVVLNGSGSVDSSGQGLVYAWGTLGPGTPLMGETGPAVTVFEPGTYRLRVRDLGNGCQDTLTVAVNASRTQPGISIAPPLVLTCDRDSTNLTALVPTDTFGIFTYRWIDPSGQLLPNDGPSIRVGKGGNYSVEVTNPANGCSSIRSIMPPVRRTAPPIMLEEPGVLGCSVGSTLIDAGATDLGADFQFSWSSSGPDFTFTADSLVIRTGAAGTYYFNLTDPATGCSGLDSVEVIREELTIGALELLILPPSCTGGVGGSVEVTGVSGGVGPYRFRLNDNRADERTFFGDLPVGDYRLSVLDAAGCTATREFTIETPQQPSVELGPDRQIVLGDSTTLDFITDAPDYDTLIWESAGPLGVPGALTQTVAPLTDRFYRLTLIDGNGCRASDTVLVRVLNELRTFVPNAFTPNGDGVNDLFFPYAGPEIRQIDRFRVYDRWGTIVHQAENFPPNDPAFGWDGLLNGKPLNSAVFVWTIEFVTAEGREVIQQGDVVLRR